MPYRSTTKHARARGPSVKTTLAIPSKLWVQAKLRAAERRTSLGELLVTALREHLRGGKG
jgi:hypothetical protein